MKKSLHFAVTTFLIMLLTGCATGEDNGSTSDPIIGKWKMMSETNNGNQTTLTDCDLMSTFEFTLGGISNNTAYYSDNGTCVPTQPESGLVVKWTNVVKNNYRLNAYRKGVKLYDLDIQTYFSDNNQNLIITSIDSEGDTRITTLQKI